MPLTPPVLRSTLFRPGQRIAVAVSGGADSVALLRRLLPERLNLGISLSVVHVHHGIRAAADQDAAFVKGLATAHDLEFHLHRTDAPAAAAALRETLEEAARNLRYEFFRQLMADGKTDAVTTAHTLDDQAETVLHKLLRGAWTEGLSGIHAVLPTGSGTVLRPFLDNDHASLTSWLQSIDQPWREDASNQELAHTRNRIRHQLIPLLRSFNPQISRQLARLAVIAGDEEAYWQAELDRILPGLLLPGRPTRGGGRSASTHPDQETVAIEWARVRAMQPAVARRVLRGAARRLGARLSFEQTEQLLTMTGRKLELPGGIVAERSPRELRLTRGSTDSPSAPEYVLPVPGEVIAPEYGISLRAEPSLRPESQLILRPWRAGDRIRLRHTPTPRKVAEVLDRLHVLGEARKNWPVIEAAGTIIWMQGVETEASGYVFAVQPLPPASAVDPAADGA